MFCAGPSESGKTSFIHDLLCNITCCFDKPVHTVIYCYGVYQPLYDDDLKDKLPGISFIKGFPSDVQNALCDREKHDLLIIDEVADNEIFRDAHVKNSHHYNYFIITVAAQNPFYKSKYFRTMYRFYHI